MSSSQMATGSIRTPSTGASHQETTGAFNPGILTLKEAILEKTGEVTQMNIGGSPILKTTGVIQRTTELVIEKTIEVTRQKITEEPSAKPTELVTLQTTGAM